MRLSSGLCRRPRSTQPTRASSLPAGTSMSSVLATAEGFAEWAGIGPRQGLAAFAALETSMTPAGTPIGDAWILTEDEATFRETAAPAGLGPPPAERRHVLPPPRRRSRTPRARGRIVGPSCGRLASGREPCSSKARSSERGDGPALKSRSHRGVRSRLARRKRSRRRRARSPCPGCTDPFASAGTDRLAKGARTVDLERRPRPEAHHCPSGRHSPRRRPPATGGLGCRLRRTRARLLRGGAAG